MKPILAAMMLGTASLSVCACTGGADTVEPEPQALPGFEIAHAQMILPAVTGNPAAIYFDMENKGDAPVTIRSVSVAKARSAQMHGRNMTELAQITVAPGDTVSLAPGGDHVMVYDLDPSVKSGGAIDVTLTTADGDKLSFPVQVMAPNANR